MDGAELARRQEEQDRLPFIAVKEFRVEYEPQSDGSMKAVEWVEWVKKGTSNPATTGDKVVRLQKFPDDPIWQVLKPYYDRWKAGQTSEIDGTALGAWPGATPQLVKALEPANIRSVEDLARMEDSAIQRLAIPNLRRKQQEARGFLEAQKSVSGVSAENLKLKNTVEAQAAQIAELKAAVEALADAKGIDIVEPKKRKGKAA
jgi:hypothetical protein